MGSGVSHMKEMGCSPSCLGIFIWIWQQYKIAVFLIWLSVLLLLQGPFKVWVTPRLVSTSDLILVFPGMIITAPPGIWYSSSIYESLWQSRHLRNKRNHQTHIRSYSLFKESLEIPYFSGNSLNSHRLKVAFIFDPSDKLKAKDYGLGESSCIFII